MRLFQWDERNFDTLRIDSRKSHRLVLEILRKFNEVFQQKTVSIVKENKQQSLILSVNQITNDQVLVENAEKINKGEFQLPPERSAMLDSVLLMLAAFHKKVNDQN